MSSNLEKLEALKAFLKENRVKFHEDYFHPKKKVSAELCIPRYKVLVRISKGTDEDNKFFGEIRYSHHPLFIRDNETAEFVIEKMQNLLVSIMKVNNKSWLKQNKQKHNDRK